MPNPEPLHQTRCRNHELRSFYHSHKLEDLHYRESLRSCSWLPTPQNLQSLYAAASLLTTKPSAEAPDI